MGQETKIAWCHATFNPWRGCQRVSPGCERCYAEAQAKRNPAVLGVWGPQGTRVVASEAMWRGPVRWNAEAARAGERRRVFCASLADVFEDWLGDMVDASGKRLLANEWLPSLGVGSGDRLAMSHVRERLGRLIIDTPGLHWLLLTKRAENAALMAEDHMFGVSPDGSVWPPNVWLGTTVEDQRRADERIPVLLKTPAAVRFLSVEPLLGPVNLLGHLLDGPDPGRCRCGHGHGFTRCPNTGGVAPACHARGCGCERVRRVNGIHWVIVGGESGPGARPCRVEWVRSVVRQCRRAGVSCFVKQLGSNVIDRNDSFGGWTDRQWPENLEDRAVIEEHIHGHREEYQGADVRVRLADKKGGDVEDWPPDLRVREFPG